MTDNTNKELYAALAKAQGEFAEIKKSEDGQIGNQRFKYADLDQLIKATRPALVKHDLAVIQLLNTEDGDNFVTTLLVHSSGQSISSKVVISRADCVRVQDFGKASSYLRRYGYSSILCLAADSDLDSPDDQPQSDQPQGRQQRSQQQRPQPRQEAAPAALPDYPQEVFDRQLAARAEGVRDGKTTPEQIIGMLESKYTLSAEQRDTLNKLSEQHA